MNESEPIGAAEASSPPAVETPPEGESPRPEPAPAAGPVADWAGRVLAEVNKVFVGQEELVRGVLAALLAEGHVLIESVPGLGKTLLVRALGRVLGCAFNRIQFTPDLMPSDVTGSPVFDERVHDFRFRPGPVFTQLLLADEINRAPAKTHSALLEIMQETRVTVDGVGYTIERPFLVLATQNPIESEGTYNLPEAQLDRFLFKLVVSYPAAAEETAILRLHTQGQSPDARLADDLRAVTGPAEVLEMQRRSALVLADDRVLGYIAALMRQTREWPTFALGASPRAGVAVLRGARAIAALEGRDFVLPDDVQEVALPALRHRVMLTPEAEVEGRGADELLSELIRSVEVPAAMIWPGRALALALLAPALLSLALFVTDAVGPAVIALDVAAALAALADLATLAGPGRFRAERRCGPVGSLGEAQPCELTIENLGRAARRLRLRDDVPETFSADPAEFVVDVPGRGRAVLAYSVVPRRRGTYHWRRVDALAFSRLGLWQRALSWRVATEVRVYPDVRQIARYTVLARRDRLSALGMRRSRRLGTDNEFERLRDYVEGDEPRHIDWRATARRRKLTVRAHQFNQSQRLIFLIDCGRMMAGDTGSGLSPLDHAFNAMLMLAHVALVRGDQVGLLAFSDRVRAYVPPAGGPRRINRLVHGVHNIFPELVEPRYDRAFLELEQRCRKRSLVVLLTNVFDDENARIVADHLGNVVGRHLPLGVFLRDHDIFALADAAPDSGPGLYRGAAAAALLNWRERVLAGLRRRGVLTLDVFPNELTAPLVNEYLQIKARHLL